MKANQNAYVQYVTKTTRRHFGQSSLQEQDRWQGVYPSLPIGIKPELMSMFLLIFFDSFPSRYQFVDLRTKIVWYMGMESYFMINA